MGWSEVASLVSAVSAAVSAIIAVSALQNTMKAQKETQILQAHNLEQQKKLETVKAYNELQKNTLSELCKSCGYYQDIADKSRYDNGKTEYKRIKGLAAECEHFSAGVELGLYDYDTVLALSGSHLYWTFKKVKPIIEKSRNAPGEDKESRYAHFEKLAERLCVSNGIKNE